jgi:hypothetical protein
MNATTFEYLLRKAKTFMAEQKKLDDVIRVIAPTSTGVVEFGGQFLDDYLVLLSYAVGDKEAWVTWFVFENDFGSKGLLAGAPGQAKPITNARELWDLIKEQNAQPDKIA